MTHVIVLLTQIPWPLVPLNIDLLSVRPVLKESNFLCSAIRESTISSRLLYTATPIAEPLSTSDFEPFRAAEDQPTPFTGKYIKQESSVIYFVMYVNNNRQISIANTGRL